jgi:esterase
MKLNYSEQGSGPAVILMHGMFGSLSNLGGLARIVAGDHKAISVDLRNHGDSPHEDAMDIPLMAADIVELMDDLGLPSAVLIGHSLGGKVAMQIALNQPQRVVCLVVGDISPVQYPQTSNVMALDGLEALSQQQITSRAAADEIMARYVDEPVTKGFLLKNVRRLAEDKFELKLNMASIIKNYATSLSAAPLGVPFSGPTLFIKGEVSAYIQERHKAVIYQLFPNARLEVMTGVGHWLHAENPAVFNDLVLNFIAENS